MSYRSIQGWFNYEFLFDVMVDRFNDCTFIEIGVWKGKSTVYLAQKIKQEKKNIKVLAVDTFEGTPSEKQHKNILQSDGISLLNQFKANLNTFKVKDIVTPIKQYSSDFLKEYKGDVKFIFIDGDHTYEGVKKDIEAALPLLSKGCVLAGHDYGNAEGVNKAVHELIGVKKISVIKNVWIYEL